MNTNTYPKAVSFLGFRNKQVLCISRRNDTTQWGFPGGKVDPGEDEKQALIREVKEETGFDINPRRMFAFYSGVCEGDVTYDVLTFFYMDELPDTILLTPETGMVLEYKDFKLLTKKDTSPFWKYNNSVFKNYKSFYKNANAASKGSFAETNQFLPKL